MKEKIISLLQNAISELKSEGVLPGELNVEPQLSPTRDRAHGDFASNIAMALAKPAKKNPREIAQKIVDKISDAPEIQKVAIAGPGFINFYLAQGSRQQVILDILEKGDAFGKNDLGKGKRVHIEYVSANPTGPLHVGHGRGAAYGATVVNLLRAVNYDVHNEYYVNDAGRQMKILAASVWLRYLEQQGEAYPFPANAYLGQYIKDVSADLVEKYEGRFHHTQESVERLIKHNVAKDPDKYLDDLVSAMQQLLSEEDYDIVFQAGLNSILDDIREDLAEFGVEYDAWFLESELFKQKLIQTGVELLDKHGYVYEKDGAKWFKATAFDDEKDRVLIRGNGTPTYFASDVAYHLHKFQQGYDKVVDVFGSDHHGYIARLRAFLKGLGEDPEKMKVLLVQFAILYRGKEKVSMSTRKGEFVTLRELRNEVGNDAARYFYIMRKPEQHLDFDLELAKSKSNENPVYYIQYAYARICSVWRQMETNQQTFDKKLGQDHLGLLLSDHESEILKTLFQYPDVITKAAEQYAPHLLANYLHELASNFHTYYNAEKFLILDPELRNARLCLIGAVQSIIRNGLTLLGVFAPEKM